jgi:hypothetical protein
MAWLKLIETFIITTYLSIEVRKLVKICILGILKILRTLICTDNVFITTNNVRTLYIIVRVNT